MSLLNIHTSTLVKALETLAREHVQITEVFLVACGGSLVDLYPSKFFLASESLRLRTELYTSNEFVHALPKVIGKHSLVIIISHTGDTPESVEAAKVAKEVGSHIVTLTHNETAQLAAFSDQNIFHRQIHIWRHRGRVLSTGNSSFLQQKKNTLL